MTVTVEDVTVINYHDPHPFAINYLGFATSDDADVHFYFNCTTTENDDPMDDVGFRTDIRLASLSDRLLYPMAPVVASIVFHFGIAYTSGFI